MQPDTQSPQVPTPPEQPIQPQVAPEQVQAAPAVDEAQRQTPLVTMSMGEIAMTNGADVADPAENREVGPVQWEAQEYISADKNPLWYVGLTVFVVGAILLDWFVLKTFFTVSALAIVIAVVLIVMHVRPARMIRYTLDDEGLRVDEQLYPLSDYKSFGVLHDGKENSIHLIPVKRFKPSLQVYFPVDAGEDIVDHLGSRLPMEELHLDFVDRIVHLFRL